jgi:hypothetical protein
MFTSFIFNGKIANGRVNNCLNIELNLKVSRNFLVSLKETGKNKYPASLLATSIVLGLNLDSLVLRLNWAKIPTRAVQSIHPPDNLCTPPAAAVSQPQIVAHLWTHNAGSHWKNAKHTSDSGSGSPSPPALFLSTSPRISPLEWSRWLAVRQST